MPLNKPEKTYRKAEKSDGPHEGCTRWNDAGKCTCPESKKKEGNR